MEKRVDTNPLIPLAKMSAESNGVPATPVGKSADAGLDSDVRRPATTQPFGVTLDRSAGVANASDERPHDASANRFTADTRPDALSPARRVDTSPLFPPRIEAAHTNGGQVAAPHALNRLEALVEPPDSNTVIELKRADPPPKPRLSKGEVADIFRGLADGIGYPTTRARAPKSEESHYFAARPAAAKAHPIAAEAPVVVRRSVIDAPSMPANARPVSMAQPVRASSRHCETTVLPLRASRLLRVRQATAAVLSAVVVAGLLVFFLTRPRPQKPDGASAAESNTTPSGEPLARVNGLDTDRTAAPPTVSEATPAEPSPAAPPGAAAPPAVTVRDPGDSTISRTASSGRTTPNANPAVAPSSSARPAASALRYTDFYDQEPSK